MTDNTKTTKEFYRHADTKEIYAVEITWSGILVGSAGPLDERLRNPNDYEYTPENNVWIESRNDKLLLMD